MQIFKSNEFFCGLSIPDPGTVDPLEGKLARGPAGSEGVDFMKVIILLLLIFQLVIYFFIDVSEVYFEVRICFLLQSFLLFAPATF